MATEEQKNNQQTLNDLLNDYKSGQIEAAEYTALVTSRTADLSDALRKTVKLKRTSSELDKQLLSSVKRISDLARTLESPYTKIRDIQKDIEKSEKEQIKLDNTLLALKSKLSANELANAKAYIKSQDQVLKNEEDFERARANASRQEKIYADELVASERALQAEFKKRETLLNNIDLNTFKSNQKSLEERVKAEKDAIKKVSELRKKQLEASKSLEAAQLKANEAEPDDGKAIEALEKAQRNYDISKEATLNKELEIKEITRDITSFTEENFSTKEKEYLNSLEVEKNLKKEQEATQKIVAANKSINQTVVNLIKEKGVILDKSIDQLATAEEQLSTDAKIYAQGKATSKINEANTKYLETQKEYLRDIEKRQAVYNLTLGFTEGLLKKLGANNAVIALGLEEGKKAAEEMAKAIEDGKESSGIFGGQLKVLGAGINATFKSMAEGLKPLALFVAGFTLLGKTLGGAIKKLVVDPLKGAFNALLSPAKKIFGEIQGYFSSFVDYISNSFFSIQGLVETFNKGDQLSQQLSQATEDIATGLGVSTQEAKNLTDQVGKFSRELGAFPEVLAQNMVALNQAFGTTQKFSDETARSFNRMVERLGFSTEEASQLVKVSQLEGQTTNETLKTIEDQTLALKNQYGVAISSKSIYQDIAKTSAATRLTLGNNAEELAKGAFHAKRLGLEMDQVASIGDSLLQFESSIANEMEAELLLGRDLNLDRARQLALQGDIAGVAKEIAGQIGSAAEFAEMNVLQQEALAKSVGVNRDELAKMLETQEMLANTGFDDMNQAQQEFNKLVESTGSIEKAQAKFRQQYGNEALASQAAQVSYAKQREMQERRLIASASEIADALMPIARALRDFQEKIEEIRKVMIDQMRPFFKELGSFIGDAGDKFAKILENYVKPLGKRLNDIGLTLIDFARKNGPEFKKTFESILDVFGSIYGLVGDIIKELFNIRGTSNVTDPLKRGLDIIKGTAESVSNYIKGIDAASIASSIKSAVSGIVGFYEKLRDTVNYIKENPLKILGGGAGVLFGPKLIRGIANLFLGRGSRRNPMFIKNVDGPGGGMFKKLLDGLKGKTYKGGQFMPGGGRAPKGGAVAGRNLMGLQFGSALGGSAGSTATALGGTALGTVGAVAGGAMGIAAIGKGIYDVSQLNAGSTEGEKAVAKGGLGGAAGGAAIGAAIGSVVPVVGTLLGAGIGAVVGYATGRMVGGLDRFQGELDKVRKKRELAIKMNQALSDRVSRDFNIQIRDAALHLRQEVKSLGGEFDPLTGDLKMSKDAVKEFAQKALDAGNITLKQFKDAVDGSITPLQLLEEAAEGAKNKLIGIRDLIFEEKKEAGRAAREAVAESLGTNLDIVNTITDALKEAKGTGVVEDNVISEKALKEIKSQSEYDLDQLKTTFQSFEKTVTRVAPGSTMGPGVLYQDKEIKLTEKELIQGLTGGKDSKFTSEQTQTFENLMGLVESQLGVSSLVDRDKILKEGFKGFGSIDLESEKSIEKFMETYSASIINNNELLAGKIETEGRDAETLSLRFTTDISDLFGKDGSIQQLFQKGNIGEDGKRSGEAIDSLINTLNTQFGNLGLDNIDTALESLQNKSETGITGADLAEFQKTLIQNSNNIVVDQQGESLKLVRNAQNEFDTALETYQKTQEDAIEAANAATAAANFQAETTQELNKRLGNLNKLEGAAALNAALNSFPANTVITIGDPTLPPTNSGVPNMSGGVTNDGFTGNIKVQNVQDAANISNNGPFTIQDSRGNLAVTHPNDKLVVSPNVSYVADGMSGKGGPVFPVSEKFGALDVKVGKEGVIVQKVNDGITSSLTNETTINHINTSQQIMDGFTGLTELRQAEKEGLPVEYQPGVNVVGAKGPFTSRDTIEPLQIGSRIIKGLGALAKIYKLSSEQKEERSNLQQEWNENYRIAYNLSKKGLDSQFAVEGVSPYYRTVTKFERLVNSINKTEKEAISKHVPIFFHDMMAKEEGRAAHDTNDYGTAIQLGFTEGQGGPIKYDSQGRPSNVSMILNTYVEPSKLYKNYTPPVPEAEVTESIVPKRITSEATERVTVRGTEGNTFVTYENGKVVESSTIQQIQDGSTEEELEARRKRFAEFGKTSVSYKEVKGTTSATKIASPDVISQLGVSGVTSENYKNLFTATAGDDRNSSMYVILNNISKAQSLSPFQPSGKSPATDSFTVNYKDGKTDQILNSGELSFPQDNSIFNISSLSASGNGLLALYRAVERGGTAKADKYTIGFKQNRESSVSRFNTDQINNLAGTFNTIRNILLYETVYDDPNALPNRKTMAHFIPKDTVDLVGAESAIKGYLNNTYRNYVPPSIAKGASKGIENVYSFLGLEPYDFSFLPEILDSITPFTFSSLNNHNTQAVESKYAAEKVAPEAIKEAFEPQYKERVFKFLKTQFDNDNMLLNFEALYNPKFGSQAKYDDFFKKKEYKPSSRPPASFTKKSGEYAEGGIERLPQEVKDGITNISEIDTFSLVAEYGKEAFDTIANFVSDPYSHLSEILEKSAEKSIEKILKVFTNPTIKKSAFNLAKNTSKTVKLPYVSPVIDALIGGAKGVETLNKYKENPDSPSISKLYQELGTIGYQTLGGIGGSFLGGSVLTPIMGPIGTVIGSLAGQFLGGYLGDFIANKFGAESFGEGLVNTFTSIPQQVEDAGASANRGPFHITDRFGATAVTAKGDGVVVSPNISYVQDGVTNAEPIAPMVTTSSQQHTTVIEQDNSELKKELEGMKQLMSQLIKEIPEIANRPITIELDGNKVGEGLGRIGYRG